MYFSFLSEAPCKGYICIYVRYIHHQQCLRLEKARVARLVLCNINKTVSLKYAYYRYCKRQVYALQQNTKLQVPDYILVRMLCLSSRYEPRHLFMNVHGGVSAPGKTESSRAYVLLHQVHVHYYCCMRCTHIRPQQAPFRWQY